jgi:hypothetical protein
LHAALSQLVRAGGGGDARAAAEAASALDLDWFVAVMARLHLNTFRVDLLPLLNFAVRLCDVFGAVNMGRRRVLIVVLSTQFSLSQPCRDLPGLTTSNTRVNNH